MLRDGLGMQRHDGAFPEKGGHDSSYHAVSLIYLQRYGWIVEDAGQRNACDAAARRGVAWLRGRIIACSTRFWEIGALPDVMPNPRH